MPRNRIIEGEGRGGGRGAGGWRSVMLGKYQYVILTKNFLKFI